MRPSAAGECAAARAGRASRSNAPLPAARAPWLFLASAPPPRRRAPRFSALQQPPHPRWTWWGQPGSRVRFHSVWAAFQYPPQRALGASRLTSTFFEFRVAAMHALAAGGVGAPRRGLRDASWRGETPPPLKPAPRLSQHCRARADERRPRAAVRQPRASRGSPNNTPAAAQGRSARNRVKQRSLVEPPAQGAARSDTRTYQRNRRDPWPRSPTPPL